jgi:hypothetical protein
METNRSSEAPVDLLTNRFKCLYNLTQLQMYRNISVGIATGYMLDGPEIAVQCLAAARDFSRLHSVETGPTQTPLQWVSGSISPGAKRQGREADHSPPSSVEVENVEAIIPLHHTSSWRAA